MDLIDKKILCELDLNARIPLSQLARKLRIGRNVVAYRISNLEKQGIISKYICSINLGLLGYKTFKIYFKLHNHNSNLESVFLKFLEDSKNVIHLLKTEGSLDFSTTVAVKTIRELDSFLNEIKNNFKDILKDYFVSIVVYSKIFKLNKLLLSQKQEVVKFEKYSAEEVRKEIDEKDELILKTLSQEANMPIIKISEKTNLSIDVIKYRLKNLKTNLINSYRVMLDFSKMGFYHYVIMLKMKTISSKEENQLFSWCSAKKNVLYYTKRIGNYDFEINTAVTDINNLNSFLSELKQEFGNSIDSYDIVINSKLIKLKYTPF